jgi:hypothetical protein
VPTGGASPKGKARGECASVLPERYQNANQTDVRQSRAFRANKTENKTVLEMRFQGNARIDAPFGVSLEMLKTDAGLLLGPKGPDLR